MKLFKCNQCESEATRVVERDEICRVKGEEIVVHGAVRLCDACGERVFDRALDSAIFQEAFEIYRTRHEMMTPADIVRLREMYDMTQRSLSALLGLGEVTIHRYEKGSIPDEAHHQLLRLIRDPRNMKQVYSENRDRLSPSAQRKLEAALGTLLGEPVETFEHQLQDPVTAALYLDESAHDSAHALLRALRDIVTANGGVSTVARKAAIDSKSLTSVLSEEESRELHTLQTILDAMGLRMSFTAKSAA
ncbi:MAG: type II TA system antitoxin MqsA family protein [Capsulimonas sp.]|uniref:type II TA system antitoxin MqsA family protein n=1 Tax=Capsulimonas sp. TaxID=2494211 RepID=UPI0032668E8C